MPSPGDSELIEVLQKAMPEGHIASLERRLHDNRSSSILEELNLHFADGRTLPLVFKNVGFDSVTDEARGIKPAFIRNPLREIIVYRDILALQDLGTARRWASLADPEKDQYWLFLEDVPGDELYEFGELEVWQLVARRLAAIHKSLDGIVAPELLDFNPHYYRRWMERASAFSERTRPAEQVKQLRHLHDRYEKIIESVESLPRGMIHGEFYASNILVDRATADARVCPIDWEMAAMGPRLIDVASLVVGNWRPEQSEAIARSYFEVVNEGEIVYAGEAEFMSGVKLCRLLMAIQWLGWSEVWRPPKQHAFDWLEEALK